MEKKRQTRRLTMLLIVVIVLVLVACTSFFYLLDASETPQCTEPMPMPTGERWMHTIFDRPLQQTVRAGETIQLDFSDSYLLIAMGQNCDGKMTITYPTLSGTRTVEVYLDDELILRTECPRQCEIEWTVPETITRGMHTLKINWDTFTIQVE